MFRAALRQLPSCLCLPFFISVTIRNPYWNIPVNQIPDMMWISVFLRMSSFCSRAHPGHHVYISALHFTNKNSMSCAYLIRNLSFRTKVSDIQMHQKGHVQSAETFICNPMEGEGLRGGGGHMKKALEVRVREFSIFEKGDGSTRNSRTVLAKAIRQEKKGFRKSKTWREGIPGRWLLFSSF